MFGISLDVDYLNIYRRNQNLALSEEDDLIITRGLERAGNLLSDFGFKATFFIVGDSVKRYRDAYLKLIENGHEIGNHTLNHLIPFDLPFAGQVRQIVHCQQIISEELGCRAVGFKAPSYNISEELYPVLCQNGIKYDTSCFSNILLPIAKILFYLRSGKSGFGSLSRLFGNVKIHKKAGLLVVPVGSTVFRLPFYGSFHAMCPLLARLRPPDFPFTYLIHPLELLENNETGALTTGFKTTLSQRLGIYRAIFGKLKESGRRCLLLKDMIEEWKE